MRLETTRLILREWAGADIPDLIEGLNNLAVTQWLAFVAHPYTQHEAQVWVRLCAETASKGEQRNAFEFAIERKAEQKVIGASVWTE